MEMFSGEECREVLRKFLRSDNFEIRKYEVVDFHNPFQGLIGEHFTLKIDYKESEDEDKSSDFFVKKLSSNPLLFSFSLHLQVYEKEEFYYFLRDEYEKFGIDTSFAPRGLFFKPYITVLEDLSKTYKSTPKKKLLDLEHCYSCLDAIAKFHASSIIYEKKKENELGKKFSLNDYYSKILEDKFATQEETIATKWMLSSIQGVLELIDLILQNYTTNNEFKTKLLEILAIETRPQGLISCVLHGDLWTSNFLHLYKDGHPIESKIVDFQTLKYGPVEQDLVEFLMTTTTRSFRTENFDGLINYYYKTLKELLIAADLNIGEILPSPQDFLSSCNNFKLAGKIHAVVDHSYTFMGDEIYKKVMKSEETFRDFLFEKRGKYVVESFNKNKQFKKMLSEDVVELRDLVFLS